MGHVYAVRLAGAMRMKGVASHFIYQRGDFKRETPRCVAVMQLDMCVIRLLA